MATLAQDECFDFAAPVREKTRLLATTRQLLPEAFPVFKTVAKVCAKVLEAEISKRKCRIPRSHTYETWGEIAGHYLQVTIHRINYILARWEEMEIKARASFH